MHKRDKARLFTKLCKAVKKNGYEVNLNSAQGKIPADKIVEFGIYNKFFFNHDFAKALWGDVFISKDKKPLVLNMKTKKLAIKMSDHKPAYLFHLSELAMLNEEARWEYLKEALNEKNR